MASDGAGSRVAEGTDLEDGMSDGKSTTGVD